MKEIIFSLTLCFLFTSCDRSENVKDSKEIIVIKEFYEDGNILAEYETIDSLRHGEARIYYPDGKVKLRLKYKNDLLEGPGVEYYLNGQVKKVAVFSDNKLSGEAIVYYENGNILSKGKYFNDLIVGKYYEYFEEKSEQIKSIKEYVIIRNESQLNSFITYNLEGEILSQSMNLTFSESDNYLQIKVNNKELDKIRAIIGDFDFLYNSKANSIVDTVNGSSNSYIYLKYNRGDTLRGYIDNYSVLDSEKIISKYLWFSYPNTW